MQTGIRESPKSVFIIGVRTEKNKMHTLPKIIGLLIVAAIVFRLLAASFAKLRWMPEYEPLRRRLFVSKKGLQSKAHFETQPFYIESAW